MRRNALMIIALLLLGSISISAQQAVPSTPEAKRMWKNAMMYIEEDAPNLAISEFESLIEKERFAPAYLKLVELCYKLNDPKYIAKAEEYSSAFMELWPDRSDEMMDIVSEGEARNKLRIKKFCESIVGDWTVTNLYSDLYNLKIRLNGRGVYEVSVPKLVSTDLDILERTTDRIMLDSGGKYQPYCNENGLRIVNLNSGSGYNVKYTDGDIYCIDMVIPYVQPYLNNRKLRALIQLHILKMGSYYTRNDREWSEIILEGVK